MSIAPVKREIARQVKLKTNESGSREDEKIIEAEFREIGLDYGGIVVYERFRYYDTLRKSNLPAQCILAHEDTKRKYYAPFNQWRGEPIELYGELYIAIFPRIPEGNYELQVETQVRDFNTSPPTVTSHFWKTVVTIFPGYLNEMDNF